MHEILLAEGEADERPAHPLISHVAVPPIALDAIRPMFAAPLDVEETTAALRTLADERRATVVERPVD
jgi:hypothetical protein